jgi:hypothetical protein
MRFVKKKSCSRLKWSVKHQLRQEKSNQMLRCLVYVYTCDKYVKETAYCNFHVFIRGGL